MMTNPFDAEDDGFYALRNAEGQFSLWSSSIEIPPGWQVAHGQASRRSCREYIDRHWTDMRPRSLADAMIRRSARP